MRKSLVLAALVMLAYGAHAIAASVQAPAAKAGGRKAPHRPAHHRPSKKDECRDGAQAGKDCAIPARTPPREIDEERVGMK